MNGDLFRTLVVAAALSTSGVARAQSTERVNVSTLGAQANSSSGLPVMSADARFVAFTSSATNLTPDDTVSDVDVFVRDRLNGTTERVSVPFNGPPTSGGGTRPAISADGRFVAFASFSDNLINGDSNGYADIFVRDLWNHTTEMVSVALGGADANDDSEIGALSISDDGRFVAFGSQASNLVASDTNMHPDVFVRDRLNASTRRVSVANDGTQGGHDSFDPAISGDGRFVAFTSLAANLTPGDTNGAFDVFVHDVLLHTTERVSVSPSGGPANGASNAPTVPSDGRYVAFASQASNLVLDDTTLFADIFVRDRLTQTTERISVSSNETPGNASSIGGSPISRDGRVVVFASYASNLVNGDLNARGDAFLRDRASGTTVRVSLTTSGGQATNESANPTVSADTRQVAFSSWAANLVPGDTNAAADIFVRDRGAPPPPGMPRCFGDGSGTACPCAAGAPGNGCPSSVNASGATLAATGTASTTWDTFRLSGTGMPDGTALFLQGTSLASGGAGVLYGDGLRCVDGTLVRLVTRTNAGGASHYPSAGDPPISVRGLVTPGLRTYQVWYRNAAAFCTAATFNTTNAWSVTWTP